MSRILVTGATGFVGSALCAWLTTAGFDVHAINRRELSNYQNSESAFQKGDVVIHCAAIAHRLHEGGNPMDEYRQINRDLPHQIAMNAAKAGARRFVFLSSAKVLGEGGDMPYTATSKASPEGPYATSKWEAEQALLGLSQQVDMDVVIVRPPLVYGPGVKGNLRQLIRVVDKGQPLPFGAVHNRRDMINLDNLCDVITRCIDAPVADKTLLVSDGEAISTTRLLTLLGEHRNCKARLLPVPTGLMRIVAKLIGKVDVANRLLGNFEVNIVVTQELLGWRPVCSVNEGFRKTCAEPVEVM